MNLPAFVTTSADGSSGMASPDPFAIPVRINIATQATSENSPRATKTAEACFSGSSSASNGTKLMIGILRPEQGVPIRRDGGTFSKSVNVSDVREIVQSARVDPQLYS